MATYHWLADGTKYRVEDASGSGVIYAGDLTYAVTVSGGTPTYALESAEASVDGTARFLKNGTAMTPYYTIRDHIGSVRTIVNASGTVVERNDYYPFGTRTTFGTSYATLATNRQKFSGKEDQTTVAGSSLPYLDFGARMYDAKLVRWNTYDPMAEKYYGVNAYGYCLNNPIRYFDPTGQKPKDVIMGGIPADKDDYNYGLQVADLTSGVVGVIMIASGEGGQTAGGGLVAVGAGDAATGIGAPEGGIAALGGIVAVAGGVVLEAGGMYILANLLREIRRALIKCKRMLIEAGLPKESKDNAALNKDGTWKNSQTDYLRQNG